VQTSPTKLETPQAIGFCYVSTVDSPFGSLHFADAACHMCYQGAPYYPHHGADPRWHVRSLDNYIYRSNPVLSMGTSSFTLNSLILPQDVSLSYSMLGDKVCTLHLAVNVLVS